MRRHMIGLFSLAAAVATSVAAYGRLPPRVPIHWDLHGRPDGYASRELAVSLLPAVMALVLMLLVVLRRVDPGRRGAPDDGGARDVVEGTAVGILGLIHGVTLMAGMGVVTDVPRAIALCLALFTLVAGNVMGRLRTNRFAGIRTPWTLRSEEVWRRTHRLGARWMVAAGVAMVPVALVLHGPAMFVTAIALLMGATLGPAVVSYFYWRDRSDRGGRGPDEP